MKILVCTDGSEHSQRVLEEASKIGEGCNADEVTIIHVYNPVSSLAAAGAGGEVRMTEKEIANITSLDDRHEEQGKKILSEALKVFEKKNINASTILKQGHPSEIITRVASEGGFDMIVIGSRGFGGLKKLLLGSVSNAVVQEASSNVLTVK